MSDPELWRPLADRMRPQGADQVIGQEHLLAPGKPLGESIARKRLHSMIFWGPPGSGKTTLARIAAGSANADFITLSAAFGSVLGGVAYSPICDHDESGGVFIPDFITMSIFFGGPPGPSGLACAGAVPCTH